MKSRKRRSKKLRKDLRALENDLVVLDKKGKQKPENLQILVNPVAVLNKTFSSLFRNVQYARMDSGC
jgi:hypothetical protein